MVPSLNKLTEFTRLRPWMSWTILYFTTSIDFVVVVVVVVTVIVELLLTGLFLLPVSRQRTKQDKMYTVHPSLFLPWIFKNCFNIFQYISIWIYYTELQMICTNWYEMYIESPIPTGKASKTSRIFNSL